MAGKAGQKPPTLPTKLRELPTFSYSPEKFYKD
jgi:hypothetical protein